jgi:AAA15 family ATPase/GTPase
MLQFERFKLTVKAHNPSTNETKAFGRDIVLGDGLNFIVGENTSGKTTIAKCFYYVLGMEELIEAKRGIDYSHKGWHGRIVVCTHSIR